ncbi:MAG: phosphatidylinositol-specific phospholipase C1-like protein [Bryobacter sp.]
MNSVKIFLTALLMHSLLAAQTTNEFGNAPNGLKINEIQVLGTHNSYAQPADPRVFAMMNPMLSKLMEKISQTLSQEQLAAFQESHPNGMTFSEGLAYRHPDLLTQLNAGLRSLEIDVNPDPEGGRFLQPASYRILREKGVTDLAPHDTSGLDQPGFKVLHIPDIDFRSHCNTLKLCLTQIRGWSDCHSGHVPLFLMIEAKSQAIPILPGSTQLAPFDKKAFDAFDQEVLAVLGREKLITPDDVRGNYPTLREAVLAKNWPTLAAARGKILLVMLTSEGNNAPARYWDEHPSLWGRVAFVYAKPEEDHAAFLLLDNALVRAKEIEQAVKKGYMVRTRADIETAEAKQNDLTPARAAFASGAQVVSTDFFRPGNVYETPYVVELPGGGPARCNPQLPEKCR